MSEIRNTIAFALNKTDAMRGHLFSERVDVIENAVNAWIAEYEKAQLDRMRDALEPFAKAADIKLCGDWRDDERFAQTDVGHYLTFGHLRAARAALEASR